MKRLLITALVLVLLVPVVARAEFWASKKSKSYHQKSCRWVAQITPEYRLKFDSKDAAWQAGYRPCQVCRPPGFAVEAKKKTTPKKAE